MDALLQEKLLSLPTGPGVYLMKDRSGGVVYVGKAVNLRSRVRSYFNRGSGDSRAFIPLLEHLLGDIETLVVNTEKEALLLENELIKKYKPRFNVQLRDDKNFICLRFDVAHPFPRIEIVRRVAKDGARYFGPYASASSIRETLRILNRYFQLRTCTDHVLGHRTRPCLVHQIGRCSAPCVYEVSRSVYRENVDEAMLFLEGKADQLVERLRLRMKDASQSLMFEEAARLRDQLIAMERSLERQKVAGSEAIDQDIFSLYREADRIIIYALFVRRGRMTGGRSFMFSGQEFPDGELLESFINLYYGEGNLIPKEILLSLEPEGAEGLSELLSEKKGERVRVLTPQRGEKLELVRISEQNARQAFLEQKQSKEETLAILERLKDRLSLARLPRRMECFDISHFQGSTMVASQVAMVDGELDKAHYRHFRIKTVQGQDDFASMYEVLSRRLKRSQTEGEMPDLLIIDGGKGQLGAAYAAMKDTGVLNVDVVGLAKSRVTQDEKSPERVFILNRKEPIVLSQTSAELFLLTRLRDEAHRFAITFQQRMMRRRNFQSVLEDIAGIGDKRKKALLRHFGSLKRVRDAPLAELSKVEGVGNSAAKRIFEFLHPTSDPEGDAPDLAREISLEDAQQETVEP